MSFKVADAYVAVTGDDSNLAADLRSKVVAAVNAATEGVEAKVGLGLTGDAPEDLLADLDSAILLAGDGKEVRISAGLAADAPEELDADVRAAIDLAEEDAKVKVTIDAKSAKESSDGLSAMLAAAVVGGLAVGPAALETAVAGSMVAITADVLKSNVVIAADYKQLGVDGAAAIRTATAPLTADLSDSLVKLDGSLKTLQPDLDSLFAGVGPDIGQFETGAVNLATNALPGVSAALQASQVDVAGFAAGLGPLGSGVGDFFTGLTTNSTTTSLGLQSVMGTLGSTFGTLGTIVGSESSAISADLLALDPVLNTVSGAIRAVADPATVGGAAGIFAAYKLDPSISSGLGNLSTRLLNLSERTADSSGVMDKFSGAALHSASALDTAAGVMGGPWGIALGAGIGLASGLVGSLISAAHASDALTLSQEGLSAAISKDGGTVGSATAAFVAQSAVQDGLASSAAAAGVSLATWTSAVVGNKAAQEAVTVAVDKANQSTLNSAVSSDQAAVSTGKFGYAAQGMAPFINTQRASTDTLTTSNQQLLNSMNAMAPQIAAAISGQQTFAAATMLLNSNTLIFNATLYGARTAAQLQYQTAAQSSVALLGLGDSQSILNTQLVNGEAAYAQATGAAGAYNTVLTSLNSSTMTADQAQNTLAQQMLTARTSFKANSESLDLNTAAGIANRQSLVQAAQAIQALGTANINAGGNLTSANAVIQQQITAFVNATGATGKAKTAIEQYLEQITQIPANVSTTVTANTQPAKADVMSFLSWVDSEAAITGTIQVNMGSIKQSGQLGGHALGGSVQAGESSWVGEDGPEIVTFAGDGYVTPNNQLGRLVGGTNPAQAAAPQYAPMQPPAASMSAMIAAPVSAPTINFYGTQYPTGEQMAQLHREFATVGAF